MTLKYFSGCECGWRARTNHNRCAVRHVWPIGLGIWGRAVFEVVHVDVEYTRVSVYLYPYYPFHGCVHYLVWSNPWLTQFVLTCWGIISQYPAPDGECALRLYCHNSFSVDVWLFVVVRALHHTPRTVLVEPMKRSLPHLEGVGLGVVLCVLNSLVNCTLHQTLAYMVRSQLTYVLLCCMLAS